MSGWTKSYRSKWTNPVFRNLLEAGIWAWMCDTAAWEPVDVRFGSQLIRLDRGQLVVSERFIAEGFETGRQAVRTFLATLTATHMITRTVTHKATIITICNYDKYQDSENTANPQGIPLTNPQANPFGKLMLFPLIPGEK